MVEIYGRTGFGHGILQTYALEMKSLIVLNPDNLRISQERVGKIIQRYSGHRPKSIFEEFGINPDKPIREQEPEPLPDRVELDDIVFDEISQVSPDFAALFSMAENNQELFESGKIYEGLVSLVQFYRLNALAVECFRWSTKQVIPHAWRWQNLTTMVFLQRAKPIFAVLLL